MVLQTDQDCLNAIAPVLPEFMGGSADLAPSNMTLMTLGGLEVSKFAKPSNMIPLPWILPGTSVSVAHLSRVESAPYRRSRHVVGLASLSSQGFLDISELLRKSENYSFSSYSSCLADGGAKEL